MSQFFRTSRAAAPRVASAFGLAALIGLLASSLPAVAQSTGGPEGRAVLRHLAVSTERVDLEAGGLQSAQFMPGMSGMAMMPMPMPGMSGMRPVQMPGMPGMQGMPGMANPPMSSGQGGMGGGMAMMMTGDTMLEMLAGACTAGLFVGGVAAAAALAPAVSVAAPASLTAIATSAGIGCGFAMAATVAGMAGMMAWRATFE